MTSHSGLRKLLQSEQGSFTVESSMVFPLLLVLTITSLFVSLYIYQNTIVYYTASKATERTAFIWDNSKRSPSTGLAPSGQYDSLYWRLKDDHMLESLLGLTAGKELGNVLPLPARGAAGEGASLVQRKLGTGAAWLTESYEGRLELERKVWGRRVKAKLLHPISIQPLEWLLTHSRPYGVAGSAIADPVEFIRSVDLVRYYAGRFNNGKEREEAASILAKRSSK
ncbi:TadE/TadG family type IV pilus assembly protein [Paenibacillus sp. SYP-B4298]|uniref:TadE/TadG family type IV pilus assembly protein n=1 Tax=Paenibacillus sp. SYP-B4298 TaxID=2996034 RepID=UPI0022DDF026|nr:TadE family protein [Paenibacillus sp. SYP-B4298]